MASPRKIRAGAAYVELFADDSRLVRGLARAQARLRAFGAAITNIGRQMMIMGAAITAPLLAAARTFGKVGDDLAKMSKRTGIAVEALSELEFVAGQTGTSLNDFENTIRRMQRFLGNAAKGGGAANAALHRLGLTMEQLQGLTPDQQFKLLADRISRIEDPSAAAAIAMETMGRAATDMLPMIQLGASGIDELQQQARAFGLTIDSETAKQAEAFTDALHLLRMVTRRVVVAIGSALVPVIKEAAARMTIIASGIRKWVEANKGLLVSSLKIGVAIIAIGAGLVTVGLVIKGVAVAMTGLIVAMKLLNAVLVATKVALGLLLTPAGLIVAAILAIGAAAIHMTGNTGKVLGWLGERFKDLQDRASESFEGIRDALASGDIALAGRIMWLTLKVAWVQGISALTSLWHDFNTWLVKRANDAWHGALAAFEIFRNAMAMGWVEITSGAAKAWESIQNIATKGWLHVLSLLDDTIDVDAAVRLVDEDTARTMAGIESKRQQRRADEESRHEQRLSQIGQDHEAVLNAINAEQEARLSGVNDELDKARKDLQEAIQEAKDQRARVDEGLPALDQVDDWFNKFRDALEGAGDALDQIQARGAFEAAAALRLGGPGQDIERQQLETQRQIARNTDPKRNRGPAFS